MRILVAGGSGFFGKALVSALRRVDGVEAIPASRRSGLDLGERSSVERALSGVELAVCAAGPFQGMPTHLPELCVARGIHYLDLADDRAYVRSVRALEPGAAALCPGWSCVPALSALLVRMAAEDLERVDTIRIQIAPGNRSPRGAGTIASLLSSLGRSFTLCRRGEWRETRGWSEPRTFRFPAPVGPRVGRLVDAPDCELFPALFGARTVEFRAGAELAVLDRAASAAAWTGLDWTPWAAWAGRAVGLLGFLGSERGALGVEVKGAGRLRRATITAERGGHAIPVLAAAAMAGLLAAGRPFGGLVPLDSWLTRAELEAECGRFGFRLGVEDGDA